MNHYVYFITNEDKMKYIGVRSSKCNPEEDTKYWGSSKYLPKDISETGVKEIVETLDTREEAVALEVELHNKWNVAVNPWFYNQAKQTSTGFDIQGIPSSRKGVCRSEETKAKISKANKGKKRTEEVKAEMSAARMGNTNTLGHKHTEATKAKISASVRGDKNPNADTKKYWFIHNLYGLVCCTRWYLLTHFNNPSRIRRLFHKKPRKSCAGWSLYKGGDVSQSIT